MVLRYQQKLHLSVKSRHLLHLLLRLNALYAWNVPERWYLFLVDIGVLVRNVAKTLKLAQCAGLPLLLT